MYTVQLLPNEGPPISFTSRFVDENDVITQARNQVGLLFATNRALKTCEVIIKSSSHGGNNQEIVYDHVMYAGAYHPPAMTTATAEAQL